MSSRVPLAYSKKVLELFRNPKNLGKIENANAEALAKREQRMKSRI